MMKQIAIPALFVATLLTAPFAFAAEQIATLSVPGMNCASCPYIIKSAISEVDGVKEVSATFETRTATVVFDDAVTSVEAIQQATADVGYPSSVIELNKGS